VFVDSVHIVNTPKQCVERLGTFVWLQVIDACKGTGAIDDALYFSTVESRFVWVFGGVGIKDGELDTPADHFDTSTTFVGQLPNEVIETGTKMVDDLPCEHGESQGNGVIPLRFQEFRSELLPRIALLVGEGWAYAGVADGEIECGELGEKLDNFRIQIVDTLIGPF
jgi:hypothetical protein